MVDLGSTTGLSWCPRCQQTVSTREFTASEGNRESTAAGQLIKQCLQCGYNLSTPYTEVQEVQVEAVDIEYPGQDPTTIEDELILRVRNQHAGGILEYGERLEDSPVNGFHEAVDELLDAAGYTLKREREIKQALEYIKLLRRIAKTSYEVHGTTFEDSRESRYFDRAIDLLGKGYDKTKK